MEGKTLTSQNMNETMRFGMEFAEQLTKGAIVCFFGGLGAGKTTFIKGVIQGLIQIDHQEISSPTFSFMNVYKDKGTQVCHFDLYRLEDANQFISSGFDDYFDGETISLIEWSEKIEKVLPDEAIKIFIENDEVDRRKLRYYFPH